MLDVPTQIARLEREGHTLHDTVAGRPLDRPVPGCPEWNVADLVLHMGDVHRWAGTIVAERLPERFSRDHAPGPDEDLLAWYRQGLDRLVAALRDTSPAEQFWFWGPAPDALSFWARRQANETAIHRCDAEAAFGDVTPLAADEALDALDEWLGLAVLRCRVPEGGRTLHIHATDGEGEWLVRLDGKLEVSTGHAKADCAIRAGASDLLLWALNRPGAKAPETHGDSTVLALWREHVRF